MFIKFTTIKSSLILIILFLLTAPSAALLSLLDKIILLEWTFFSSSASPIVLSVILDPYGLIFSSTVLLISSNVLIFAKSYISDDPFVTRFTHLVLLFVASINLLIFIPNLITLLLGWDGLGLTSFLLVIYYQNAKSLSAGIITALTNRVGDVLILLTIGWIIHFGQWSILFSSLTPFNSLLGLRITIAAITKSAQIPFSSWLPAAMAAPTPVSALVHSSTLVTAGIFLLFRFYPFLSSTPYFNKFLLIIATLTTLIAGLRANTECDMKKIIALSTLSQLGVIIVSLGLGAPFLAFFHLITHALFKALLFLCAGTLIHLHLHSQDLRYIGNIFNQIPSISAALIVSNLALCGAPFLAGFYSKDLILEAALFNQTNFIIILLFFFATGLTVSYTIRFLLAVLWSPTNVSPCHPINDNDKFCSYPTLVISLSAICGGRLINWLIITPSFEPCLPPYLKFLTLTVSIFGLILGYLLSSSTSPSSPSLMAAPKPHYATSMIWFLTPLSSQKIMPAPIYLSHHLTKTLDHGWVELLGGQGAFLSLTPLATNSIHPHKNIFSSHLIISLLPLFLIFFFIFLGSLSLKHNIEAVKMVFTPLDIYSVKSTH